MRWFSTHHSGEPSRLHTPNSVNNRSSHFGISTALCVSIRWYARLMPSEPKMKLPTSSDATPHHVKQYGRNASTASRWRLTSAARNQGMTFGWRALAVVVTAEAGTVLTGWQSPGVTGLGAARSGWGSVHRTVADR